MGVTFSARAGRDPLDEFARLAKQAEIQADDIREVLERQRARILVRTAQGRDWEDRPFAPYSERGPYYHYPAGRAGAARFTAAQKRGAASRFRRKVGGAASRSGTGVRFGSYGDFKRSLGRGLVDLFGARAPHMLQALITSVRSAVEGRLGIYGAEAARAAGHHDGISGRLPRRRFLGASGADQTLMARELLDRLKRRLGR